MRWLAIANPAAGRAREADRMLVRLGRLQGFSAEVVRTQVPGDGTRIARAAGAFDGLIAIGGDGTIGELLQGIDLSRQRLAILPSGHGNCLARDLGVGDAERALGALRRGMVESLDLMAVETGFADGTSDSRLCASTLAVGYVTDVVMYGRGRLPRLGRAAYGVAAMLAQPHQFEARLAVHDRSRPPSRYTGLVINNTAHLANFRGFPDASPRDGMLDIMEQSCCWSRQLLHNCAVLAGSRSFGPLRMRQARAERIELVEPRTLMADGEMLHNVRHVDVSCRGSAACCVVGDSR